MDSNDFYGDDIGDDDTFDLSPTEARKRAEEMLKRIVAEGRLGELMFRSSFVAHVVTGIKELLGNDGVLELLCAIDNASNWETEIIAERADVENVMLNKYGAFDDDIWEKVKETIAWTQFHKAIYELSTEWVEKAVDEVVNQH